MTAHLQCHGWQLWLNSQTGYFSSGPTGPGFSTLTQEYPIRSLCSTADMLKPETCVRYLTNAESGNYDSVVLTHAWNSYQRMCINNLFGIEHQCSDACGMTVSSFIIWFRGDAGTWKRREPHGHVHEDISVFLDALCFNIGYSGMHRRKIVRDPEPRISWDGSSCDALFDRKEIQGGLTRFSFDFKTPKTAITNGILQLDTKEHMLAWLSQAHHILNVGEDIGGAEKCFIAEFFPILRFKHPNGPECRCDQSELSSTKPNIYLFVQPPPAQFSEIESWLRSQVSYWSFDEDGVNQMSECTRKRLHLPRVELDFAFVRIHSWPQYVYDALYTWQVARGFDPNTPEFARSLGYPILEPVT
ncbi:hypothetical protein VNI00_017451 [Paramarasmius palmivorus]|uniref:Uncharacterized protein n=1 Tax=Paramarasmius palmivorus TaxID=297713 RepID=A0AAW0B643_9AGAR